MLTKERCKWELKANISKGEEFYINSINATEECINYMKEEIKSGRWILDQKELDMAIKKEYQDDFKTGKAICPQMIYYKNY